MAHLPRGHLMLSYSACHLLTRIFFFAKICVLEAPLMFKVTIGFHSWCQSKASCVCVSDLSWAVFAPLVPGLLESAVGEEKTGGDGLKCKPVQNPQTFQTLAQHGSCSRLLFLMSFNAHVWVPFSFPEIII